ncbi:rRNA pseudouridine synthase [Candidatus Parcubacteria bacterium]|jgi:23S rRNA pseudouridine2605 synthase|nr:rRNA pseudouridine synthase [Candidatus Parcubacteria bacterium]MBT3949414.1 rRNA pseudouridine synthase [Candidatus Parcubacteria bacterium]
MLVRLQKHIADLGICSRRKAEVLISEKKVKVNGETVTELGVKVDPEKDTVTVEGRKNKHAEPTDYNQKMYILLNKPIGYISSASSKQGDSVLDLLTKENCVARDKRDIKMRVYPVGRLDKDSEGLVLLTNDGELTNELTHPRYEHEKEYEIVVEKPLSRDTKKVLETGMKIGDDFVQGIKIKKEFNKGRKTIVTVILKEGKNRQVRKMFGNLGYNVQSLKRTRINKLKLNVLPVGKWKLVKKEDII